MDNGSILKKRGGYMNFVAIDVETANADIASICQVGIARYENGFLAEEWKSYIDPETYFCGVNISIHGITEETVKGAPSFPQIYDKINQALAGRITVCHTPFDRASIRKTVDKYNLTAPECTWLDSARVVRRAWPDLFSKSGYGLSNVCNYLGYEFGHHDALEDAKAAAHVLISAIKESDLDLDGWLKRVEKPISANTSTYDKRIKRDGNPDGPMFGDVLAFTGSLEIPRREAADIAAQLGCKVNDGVTKKTTLLVIGDQDVSKLAGHEKSSKHRKAEEFIKKGIPIRILKESDFVDLQNT